MRLTTRHWMVAAAVTTGLLAIATVGVLMSVETADTQAGATQRTTAVRAPTTTTERRAPNPTTTTTTTTSAPTTTTLPAVVPEVVDLLDAVAIRRLEAPHLAYVVVRVEEATRAPEQWNRVIAVDPVEGAALAPGETVSIVVAQQPTPDLVDAGDVPWRSAAWVSPQLAIGRCGNWSEVTEGAETGLVVYPVDCATAHAFERTEDAIVAELMEPDTAAERRACQAQFSSYVGTPADKSALWLNWIRPSGDAWAGGDRTLICLVAAPPGKAIVGSSEGTYW